MLQAMRGRSATWVTRILFTLIALSFLGWGVTDYVRPPTPGTQTALTVGDRKMNGMEVQRLLGPQIDQMRAMFGGIDREQAKRFGLVDQALDQLIARLVVDQESARLGLLISDDVLRQTIQTNPAFLNAGGQFDRARFVAVLAQAGYSEAAFLAQLRGDLSRAALTIALAAGAQVPDAVVERLLTYRLEKRVAEFAFLTPDMAPIPATPTEEALIAFHKDNPQRFTAPERRAGKLLVLDAPSVAEQVQVSEKDLRAAFDTRIDEFQLPERRLIEQILVNDEAAAKSVTDKLTAGADFPTVAVEVGQSADSLVLGEITKNDLPDPALGAAAFGLAQPGVTAPVKTAFGFHILRVVAITPGVEANFDAVKAQLEASLKDERALDLMFERSNKIEDLLSAGGTLEDAAASTGARLIDLPSVDRRGQLADGTELPADLTGRAQVISTLFATETGKNSRLLEIGGRAFVAVRTGDITPATVQPFDSIREIVIAAWTDSQRDAALAAQAEAVATAVRAGKPLADLVQGGRTSEPFDRRGTLAADLPPAPTVQTGLFDAQTVGTVVTGKAGSGYIVARLTAIQPPSAEEAATARAALKSELGEQAKNDAITAVRQGLQSRYPVTQDRAALDKLF
ncbi:SurA N-terminal domain-containing protein [Elstera sp.]|jgi:peptidyl-prolyl cis-trans isomerase D|uniref:SurA N-terminal domain-containing protein n=1 Tax=Elstera sp. TaxID=1916664 RepID=UPI0037BFCEDA